MAKKRPLTLKDWMQQDDSRKDETVASAIGISRVQISRIRRGLNGASKATAHKLETLTGIPWHEFISGAAQ